ncbi:hypothetical protein [Wohlfahrtiimonas chitiniclastica]|uniref:hypothetical protein n=1 Tax=Wohlfahrtiimonas chitiniclastica TaxID=400946 RepID=UPI0021588E73|nr:hypothetical protein [Wohlfahrtiimonas chitiniclastica]MDC7252362.1 hypothetical protein [Wohlfahrtiimonas chitiniclastica]
MSSDLHLQQEEERIEEQERENRKHHVAIGVSNRISVKEAERIYDEVTANQREAEMDLMKHTVIENENGNPCDIQYHVKGCELPPEMTQVKDERQIYAIKQRLED